MTPSESSLPAVARARGTVLPAVWAVRAALGLCAVLAVGGCSPEDDTPLLVRNIAGGSVAMHGAWGRCVATGGPSSELTVLVFSSRQPLANVSVAEDTGTNDCTGTLEPPSRFSATFAVTGPRTVAWDPGPPPGLADPVTVTGIEVSFSTGGGDKAVGVVDDRLALGVLYLTFAADASSTDSAGYPAEVRVADALAEL